MTQVTSLMENGLVLEMWLLDVNKRTNWGHGGGEWGGGRKERLGCIRPIACERMKSAVVLADIFMLRGGFAESEPQLQRLLN